MNLEQLRGPLCYLATPYTKYPKGIEEAFVDASKIAAALLSAGVKVYSPIAHCYPIAIHGDIDPLAHDIWLPYQETMMRVCAVLIVAQLPGWDSSYGVTFEIDHFERAEKPIFDLVPETLFMKKRNGAGA